MELLFAAPRQIVAFLQLLMIVCASFGLFVQGVRNKADFVIKRKNNIKDEKYI